MLKEDSLSRISTQSNYDYYTKRSGNKKRCLSLSVVVVSIFLGLQQHSLGEKSHASSA